MSSATATLNEPYAYRAESGMTAILVRELRRVKPTLRPLLHPGADSTFKPARDAEEQAAERDVGSTAIDAGLPVEEQKTQADRAIAQLLQFRNLDANWDGHEAARPLLESLDDAREFIRSLSPESMIPRATLHADGHAVLLLCQENTYAELEFLGNKTIGFYARRDGHQWAAEFSFDGGALPVGLSQIGFVVER